MLSAAVSMLRAGKKVVPQRKCNSDKGSVPGKVGASCCLQNLVKNS